MPPFSLYFPGQVLLHIRENGAKVERDGDRDGEGEGDGREGGGEREV